MKTAIILLVLASIIVSFACYLKPLTAEESAVEENAVVENYIIPDSSCSLSTEEREMIEKAWFEENGYKLKWCSEKFPEGMRCYGKHADAVILFKPKPVVSKTLTAIGKEIILSEKGFEIYAFVNGRFVVFSLFNKENPVSECVAKSISRIHALYENEVRRISKIQNIVFENDFTPPTLQEDVKEQINKAYMEKYGTVLFDSFGGIKNDVRYYGNYNGYEIIFIPSPMCVVTEMEIAGCRFLYGSAFNILAYKDNCFHKLENAYENEWLSNNDVLEIAKTHYYIEQL